jgi:hypothetical protein
VLLGCPEGKDQRLGVGGAGMDGSPARRDSRAQVSPSFMTLGLAPPAQALGTLRSFIVSNAISFLLSGAAPVINQGWETCLGEGEALGQMGSWEEEGDA